MGMCKALPCSEVFASLVVGRADSAQLPLVQARASPSCPVGCVSVLSIGSQRFAVLGTANLWRKILSRQGSRHTKNVRTFARAAVEVDLEGERIADDYYSILGLTPYATPEEIKKAYYGCMKACHPDLSGNNPENVAFCQFVNEVYEVLSDPEMRALYDEINGYTVTGNNPFFDTSLERDHVFVDEFTCIGCKNCANTAERTFIIEEDFGRARVCSQLGDRPALVQEAIDTCPVTCIHWVTAPQVTLLEDEMRRMERVNVGMMLAGMGNKGGDIFAQASWRWQKRQAKALEAIRIKKVKEKGKGSQWGDFWEPSTAAQESGDSEEPSSERRGAGRRYDKKKMEQAAAAARRWREYSRSGIDRKATRFIGAASNDRN